MQGPSSPRCTSSTSPGKPGKVEGRSEAASGFIDQFKETKEAMQHSLLGIRRVLRAHLLFYLARTMPGLLPPHLSLKHVGPGVHCLVLLVILNIKATSFHRLALANSRLGPNPQHWRPHRLPSRARAARCPRQSLRLHLRRASAAPEDRRLPCGCFPQRPFQKTWYLAAGEGSRPGRTCPLCTRAEQLLEERTYLISLHFGSASSFAHKSMRGQSTR